jgi:group I intron endonuclease
MTSKNIKRKSGIYTIENIVTGSVYVGSAVYLRGRKMHHTKRLSLGEHRNTKLQHSWNKYGASAFVFNVLLHCSICDLLFYEQRAINSYMARCSIYNLNLVAGSAIGRKHTDETKRKIGLGRTGKKHSEETIALYKKTRKGVRPSDEARKKMSEFQKTRIRSKEHKKKISESVRASWPARKAKFAPVPTWETV